MMSVKNIRYNHNY